MVNVIRAYGEERYGESVDLNKDIKKFAKFMKKVISRPGTYIDLNQSNINNLISTEDSTVVMEGNFELNKKQGNDWKISGKAGYFKSYVGNDYGVYIDYQNPDIGEWYSPKGNGIELSDKIIGKPKKLIKHIFNDDNLIAMHGVSAKANAMAGDDLFYIYAQKSTLRGGKGEDSYWIGDSSKKLEVIIKDFEQDEDKIIITDKDVLGIETTKIGNNTRIDIGNRASILLNGVRLDSDDIDFNINNNITDTNGVSLLSML